ncbi:MAG: peptidoglycan DD-metalloendopeptidase family protein [Burkholderiales bacterium]|jgi:lipoprotein NlpD|nr:peptidoglycan DD-metalloendopeptidase family protein [Burkholderiales bacterium]
MAESALSSGKFKFFRYGRLSAKTLIAVFLVVALAGCSTTRQAPVEERQPQIDDRVTITPRLPTVFGTGTSTTPSQAVTEKIHTVRQGETLFSIAQQNNVEYRELAGWNNITDPSKLNVGQVLRLTPPEGYVSTAAADQGVTTAPLQTVPPVSGAGSGTTVVPTTTAERGNIKTEPKAEKRPYSEQALMAMSRANERTEATPPTTTAPPPSSTTTPQSSPPQTATASAGDIDWSWPTQGKLISTYSEKSSFKGIDIVGNAGQPVVASAAGRVVYVGSGLRGYGKLVIVKHNDTFLSVYAHNRELLVEQGQQVTRGQKIAEMGNTDADQVKLHFEIRREGKPVDPLQYLPAR